MQQKNKSVKSRTINVKSFGMVVLLIFIFSLSSVSAQNLYVKESNGTETAYALNSIRNMSLSSGKLIVTKADNSSGSYALNGLRYLNFSKSSGVNEQMLNAEQLMVYPNPAINVLNIDLTGATQEVGTLSIFNIEGKAIIHRQVRNEGVITLDISHLPKGIYLCRYNNSLGIKTVKIVKQ